MELDSQRTNGNKRPRKKPYLVDNLPPIRWYATCRICDITRLVSRDQIADGSWIICPTCDAACDEEITVQRAA